MEKEKELYILRHSMSHILATAVLELWPDVKFAIGPAVDNGFYYDIDFGETKITDSDLNKFEKKMMHIIKQDMKFEKNVLEIKDAIEREKNIGQNYKEELLKDLKKEGEKKATYYKLGKLSKEEIKSLNALDFCWNCFDEKWDKNFAKLCEFKKKHGHVNVTSSYKDYKSLSRWVSKQRAEYISYIHMPYIQN